MAGFTSFWGTSNFGFAFRNVPNFGIAFRSAPNFSRSSFPAFSVFSQLSNYPMVPYRYFHGDYRDKFNQNSNQKNKPSFKRVLPISSMAAVVALAGGLWAASDDREESIDTVKTRLLNVFKDDAEKTSAIASLIESIDQYDVNASVSEDKQKYEILIKHILTDIQEKWFSESQSDEKQQFILDILKLTALYGKVSLLRLYKQSNLVNFDQLQQCKIARKLLNHPSADLIEQTVNQLAIGKIRNSGEQYALSYYEDQLMQREASIFADQLQEDLGSGDMTDDMVRLITFLYQSFRRKKKIKESFDDVVVFDVAEMGKNIPLLLQSLKRECEQTGEPATVRYITTGGDFPGHFTIGTFMVEKRLDGKFKAKSLYIDPLGSSMNNDPFEGFVQYVVDEIQDTTFYTSEHEIQKAPKGCSVFTLLLMINLVDLPNLFAQYPEYPYHGPTGIFDYVAAFSTALVQETIFDFKEDSGRRTELYNRHLVLLPWVFLPPMQSNNDPAEETYYIYKDNEEVDEQKRTSIGRAGFKVAMEMELKQGGPRAQELSTPVVIGLDRGTPVEIRERYSKEEVFKGKAKKMPRRIEAMASELRDNAVVHLLGIRGDIPSVLRQYDVDAYLKRHNAQQQESNSNNSRIP
jgi:hypothetical protein